MKMLKIITPIEKDIFIKISDSKSEEYGINIFEDI